MPKHIGIYNGLVGIYETVTYLLIPGAIRMHRRNRLELITAKFLGCLLNDVFNLRSRQIGIDR